MQKILINFTFFNVNNFEKWDFMKKCTSKIFIYFFVRQARPSRKCYWISLVPFKNIQPATPALSSEEVYSRFLLVLVHELKSTSSETARELLNPRHTRHYARMENLYGYVRSTQFRNDSGWRRVVHEYFEKSWQLLFFKFLKPKIVRNTISKVKIELSLQYK